MALFKSNEEINSRSQCVCSREMANLYAATARYEEIIRKNGEIPLDDALSVLIQFGVFIMDTDSVRKLKEQFISSNKEGVVALSNVESGDKVEIWYGNSNCKTYCVGTSYRYTEIDGKKYKVVHTSDDSRILAFSSLNGKLLYATDLDGKDVEIGFKYISISPTEQN